MVKKGTFEPDLSDYVEKSEVSTEVDKAVKDITIDASQITGVLPPNKGGTGQTTLVGNPSLLYTMFDNAISGTDISNGYIPLFTASWADGCYSGVKNFILTTVYPVGSIYFSYSATSPASLFGGSWTQITGRFIRAANDVSTGGADTITLTTAQLPAHSHTMGFYGANWNSGTTDGHTTYWGKYLPSSGVLYSANTGSGSSHSNAPAYQDLYCWRRTA